MNEINSSETENGFGSDHEDYKGAASYKNKGSSEFMLSGDRASFYRTLSALLGAGIDFNASIEIIVREYNTAGNDKFASIISNFCNAVTSIRERNDLNAAKSQKEIRSIAIELFNKQLLKTEELILLQGLANSQDDTKLLDAAAKFLTNDDIKT